MSDATREFVCQSFGQITDEQRGDLMNADPATGTSTELIEFLQELFTCRAGVWIGKLKCSSVRRDHPTPDGPNGHQGGNGVDFTQIADPDDAVVHLVQDVQSCTAAKGIGLGGPFQKAADYCGGYNSTSRLFQDNNTDHIHVQVVGY